MHRPKAHYLCSRVDGRNPYISPCILLLSQYKAGLQSLVVAEADVSLLEVALPGKEYRLAP